MIRQNPNKAPEQLYDPIIRKMHPAEFLEARSLAVPPAGSFSSVVNRESEHCKFAISLKFSVKTSSKVTETGEW